MFPAAADSVDEKSARGDAPVPFNGWGGGARIAREVKSPEIATDDQRDVRSLAYSRDRDSIFTACTCQLRLTEHVRSLTLFPRVSGSVTPRTQEDDACAASRLFSPGSSV
jgi:hypothetical protein